MKVYDFLSTSLRVLDSNGVLERFMGAVQEQFDYTQGQIKDLSRLRSLSRVKDDEAQYLCALLGWDGNGGTDFVPSDPVMLKRFSKFGVELWAGKGTRAVTNKALSSIIGVDASSRDVFQLMSVIGESSTGAHGWIDGGLILDHSYIQQDLEAQGLDPSAYTPSPLSWAHLYLDSEGVTEDTMEIVFNMTQFMRPSSVAYLIFYCATRCVFVDKSTSKLETTLSLPYADEVFNQIVLDDPAPDPSAVDFERGAVVMDELGHYGFRLAGGRIVVDGAKTLSTFVSLKGRFDQGQQGRSWSICYSVPSPLDDRITTVVQAVFRYYAGQMFITLSTAMRQGGQLTDLGSATFTEVDPPADLSREMMKNLVAEMSVSVLDLGAVSVQASFGGGEVYSMTSQPSHSNSDLAPSLEGVELGLILKGYDLYSLTCLTDQTHIQPVYDSAPFGGYDILRKQS